MKNLLLVSIEDLNDWIEPLAGHPNAVTPNLKRLAAMGAVFKHAYAAAPACSPSRTAALFSKYPWETGVYGNTDRWFDYFPVGGKQSLIGRLKEAGMTTLGCGKVFHSSYRANEEARSLDMEDWNDFYLAPKVKYPAISRSVMAGDLARNADFGVDPTGLPSYDDLNADWICERIKPGAQNNVWALGIYRPHLPFIAPQKFFDLIPEKVSLPPGLGANEFDPDSFHLIDHLPSSANRMARKQTKTGRILHEHGEYNDFLRAYLASIAYADSKLGQVLDRLEECNLMNDTLIVLWSDHGWQLGEKLAFRKFTLWERALRVPLMIAGPGLRQGDVGQAASLVDLAPTIIGLLGLDPVAEFSGQDLSPLLVGHGSVPRHYAPSSWGVGFKDLRKLRLAYSVRSERYRLTRYWNDEYELYDHATDPFEHTNLAGAGFDPGSPGMPAEIRELAAAITSIQSTSVAPLDVQRGRRAGSRAAADDENDDD